MLIAHIPATPPSPRASAPGRTRTPSRCVRAEAPPSRTRLHAPPRSRAPRALKAVTTTSNHSAAAINQRQQAFTIGVKHSPSASDITILRQRQSTASSKQAIRSCNLPKNLCLDPRGDDAEPHVAEAIQGAWAPAVSLHTTYECHSSIFDIHAQVAEEMHRACAAAVALHTTYYCDSTAHLTHILMSLSYPSDSHTNVTHHSPEDHMLRSLNYSPEPHTYIHTYIHTYSTIHLSHIHTYIPTYIHTQLFT